MRKEERLQAGGERRLRIVRRDHQREVVFHKRGEVPLTDYEYRRLRRQFRNTKSVHFLEDPALHPNLLSITDKFLDHFFQNTRNPHLFIFEGGAGVGKTYSTGKVETYFKETYRRKGGKDDLNLKVIRWDDLEKYVDENVVALNINRFFHLRPQDEISRMITTMINIKEQRAGKKFKNRNKEYWKIVRELSKQKPIPPEALHPEILLLATHALLAMKISENIKEGKPNTIILVDKMGVTASPASLHFKRHTDPFNEHKNYGSLLVRAIKSHQPPFEEKTETYVAHVGVNHDPKVDVLDMWRDLIMKAKKIKNEREKMNFANQIAKIFKRRRFKSPEELAEFPGGSSFEGLKQARLAQAKSVFEVLKKEIITGREIINLPRDFREVIWRLIPPEIARNLINQDPVFLRLFTRRRMKLAEIERSSSRDLREIIRAIREITPIAYKYWGLRKPLKGKALEEEISRELWAYTLILSSARIAEIIGKGFADERAVILNKPSDEAIPDLRKLRKNLPSIPTPPSRPMVNLVYLYSD